METNGETYTTKQVQKLVYQAFKQGQGGWTTGTGGILAVQNRRMAALRKLFPKLFPARRAPKREMRREQRELATELRKLRRKFGT